jgi:hypothetical protein
MVLEHVQRTGVDGARKRAARERVRAVRAAGIAARHEALALRAGPELRPLHREMAEMHREMESTHLAAARLHGDYADRLAAWADGRVQRVPRFVTAVASAVGAPHVGISLVLGDRTEAMIVASDPIATAAHEAEFVVGEGPVHDATTARTLVEVDEQVLPRRWPQFAPKVARLGVRAVSAAPLLTKNACLGALTVFAPSADPGGTGTLSAVADALARTLLAPDSTDPLDVPLIADGDDRAVVHQATGMIAVQLACSVADALVVLRARAFACDEPLAVIASEVVHAELRLS